MPRRGRAGRDRSIGDGRRLRAPRRRTVLVFELDDVDGRGRRTLEEQWRASADDMRARGRTARASERHRDRLERTVARWLAAAGASASWRYDVDDERARHAARSRLLHARRWSITAASATGPRRSARRATRGETHRLRRRDARPRRADDRAARRLRDPRARGRATPTISRSAAVLVTTGQLSRGFHLPAGDAAAVRRNRSLRGGTPRARAPPVGERGRSCRTSAT